MSFQAQLEEKAAFINAELDKLVPMEDNLQKNIYEAMRYSLLAGGKRIRPVLTLSYAELLDVPRETVLPFACALEMIHTYSLIHDDLPAMDNDDLRRGRPTCHKQFNEALAILAGDALLNKAFEVMAQACDNTCDGQKAAAVKMMLQVASCSGSEGMIGGQVVDLESEGTSVEEETVRYTYALKTGALLTAPAFIAISAAGAEGTPEAERILSYTKAIGLAFQIKDDILDVEGDTALLGKAVGRDVKEDKRSMAAVKGLDYCKCLLNELTLQAISNAESFGDKGFFLKEMATYLLKRSN